MIPNWRSEYLICQGFGRMLWRLQELNSTAMERRKPTIYAPFIASRHHERYCKVFTIGPRIGATAPRLIFREGFVG
jgi:hypothetical protein